MVDYPDLNYIVNMPNYSKVIESFEPYSKMRNRLQFKLYMILKLSHKFNYTSTIIIRLIYDSLTPSM